jgi:hypothetical protein
MVAITPLTRTSTRFTSPTRPGSFPSRTTPWPPYGGRGNDEIYGADGPDILNGGPGRDKIDSGPAGAKGDKDSVGGGPGRDRIDTHNQNRDLAVGCGPGRDRAVIDTNDPRPIKCEVVIRRR